MSRRIAVLGLGYVGLPAAALLAEAGATVLGVDTDPAVVAAVNAGQCHIVEPGLSDLVARAVASGRLTASPAPTPAEVFIIAVPTPLGPDKRPDLACVRSAAGMIAPALGPGALVILESTVPVGTTEALEGWLASARPDLSFPAAAGEAAEVQIAYCPERVLPGQALRELVENDRIVGGLSRRAADMAAGVYGIVVTGECLRTGARTAEMCKLAENSARDVQIAFANELSVICDRKGIDVWEVIALANRHPRVDILRPGPGVGGHCIAVDPWFIVDGAPEDARLIRAAREGNDTKPDWVVGKVRGAVRAALDRDPARDMPGVTVACLGLSFKPDIDDLRESPALAVTRSIAGLGCKVLAVEPHIARLPDRVDGLGIDLVDLDSALDRADVVCALVRHSAFEGLRGRLPPDTPLVDAVGI